jgi:hypothetical protein
MNILMKKPPKTRNKRYEGRKEKTADYAENAEGKE